jgi:poly-gamma-glutamate synthase PgsB/CapB
VTAAMRESGFTVLAKTTGSRPVIIHPDGSETEIRRRGPASILEGKRLLKAAADRGAGAIVAEMMSIHPESSFVESAQILQPQVLAITNVRVDHVAQMGSSKQSVAQCLATTISKDMTVVVPDRECFPVFEDRAQELGSQLIRISTDPKDEGQQSHAFEIGDNRRLALALTDHLGIERETAVRGMSKRRPDFGAPKVWSMELGSPPNRWQMVSLFAANDPESTRTILDYVIETGVLSKAPLVGLLSLRRDRGDRSFQWLEAINRGGFPDLGKLFVTGDHASTVAKKLGAHPLRGKSPEKIMEEIFQEVAASATLVGMGNMGGVGKELASYWSQKGDPL